MTAGGDTIGAEDQRGSALFFFGTLMDPDVLALVLGRPIEDLCRGPATLTGYVRRRVRGESFPLLVPRAGGRVEGVLVEGLSRADISRLRYFEGSAYLLAPCRIITPSGIRAALAFLVDGGHGGVLRDSGLAWDLDQWQQRDKPRFLVRAAELMARCRIGPDGSPVTAGATTRKTAAGHGIVRRGGARRRAD